MAKQVNFPLPVEGWRGLYAPEYIVRVYRLTFKPTAAAIEHLNIDVPQGLVYMQFVDEDSVYDNFVMVAATRPELFDRAVTDLDEMTAEVERVRRDAEIRALYEE